MAVGLPEGPVYPGTPLTQTIFLPCSPLNDRRGVARSFFKIGLSSLFSCLSLARLLILILLLISGNVHPNPCPIFPCSVCAGNLTWPGRSVQCRTCSNWVYSKCSLLSFSRSRIILSHPVDLICIQESNLNLSSSFQISGFPALRSDGTHSRSGIFSTDDTDASGGVIIFVRQILSFSKLSTSSLSLLDPYSDYIEINISLNDSSSLSFLNVYASPIRFSPKDSRANFFSPSIFPSSRNLFILGDLNCHHPF